MPRPPAIGGVGGAARPLLAAAVQRVGLLLCSQPHSFEPAAHKHAFGDYWLKFSEAPEVNMRVPMLKSYMQRHRKELPTHEAKHFPWWSGVLLLAGTRLSNGTWGPRAFW